MKCTSKRSLTALLIFIGLILNGCSDATDIERLTESFYNKEGDLELIVKEFQSIGQKKYCENDEMREIDKLLLNSKLKCVRLQVDSNKSDLLLPEDSLIVLWGRQGDLIQTPFYYIFDLKNDRRGLEDIRIESAAIERVHMKGPWSVGVRGFD